MFKLTEQNTAGARTRAFQHAQSGHAPKVTVVKGEMGCYAVRSRVSGNLYAAEVKVKADGTVYGECSCAARQVCYHLVAVVAVHIGLLSMRERSRIEQHTHTSLSALARSCGADIPVYSDEKPVVKAPAPRGDGPLVSVQQLDAQRVKIGGRVWRI